jgi:hypothetical protein
MFKLPDFPTIDWPSIDFSRFDLAALGNLDLTKRLPEIDASLTSTVRDAAYLAIGFGVIAAEKAQEARRQITETIVERADARRAQLESFAAKVPAQARSAFAQVRDLTEAAADQARTVLRRSA